MRIASFSVTRNQKNRRKKNKKLIMACPLGNSQSLESQSGLYSAIRNRLTTQSKPDLRYPLQIQTRSRIAVFKCHRYCTRDGCYAWYAINFMCFIWNTDVGRALRYGTLLPVPTRRLCDSSLKCRSLHEQSHL